MTDLDKKHVDFLTSLAELLYEKVRPDTKFRNNRIAEWYDSLPPPPTSVTDSVDRSAIDEITEIHQQLERIDDENAIKGYRWGGYVIDDFSKKLHLLGEKIKNSDVDPSIYNLFHLHKSVLLRAKGQYDNALKEISNSTALLQKKIDSYEQYLPRYTREIFMNIGASSELYRLSGKVNDAIITADEMLKRSMIEREKEEYFAEDRRALCLSTSWALYYCCEAHLAVTDWDNFNSKIGREWYFSETFSQDIYRDWTVPVLIRIIGNVIWEKRYPEYFEKIADLVYIGTAPGNMKQLMREASVFFGRIRLRPTMPIALLTLVALLTIKNAHANPTDGQHAPDYRTPIVTTINNLKQEGHSINSKSRESIVTAIGDEINRIISSRESDSSVIIGGGEGFRAEAHRLLPLSAFASDRGVGVA